MKKPAAAARAAGFCFLLVSVCFGAGWNGVRSERHELVSRALVLLPEDRARPGAITFELEQGPHAGPHRCEALGRGRTSLTPIPGWTRSAIDTTTIYYAPMSEPDGATPPGIYDVRNISTAAYELAFLNRPEDLRDEGELVSSLTSPDAAQKPYFSAIWTTWYPKGRHVMPVDMLWSRDYQRYSQGAAFPFFERRPQPKDDFERQMQAKQLSRNKRYYFGPFGRGGLAVHTDRWDEPDRKTNPKYAGRPELSDFRFRDTDGCLKVRPDCLELLNEWIEEQSRKGRRTQLEVRETRP